ncbi:MULTISPECIES: hypothetical protein [Oscillatoriales]|uniref:Uncharacterized protein n=1 Tax=Aerosakkonema funiforme FACHB-1375 TaxID=2949571 RepID=A0A926VGM2_9CYAN|nr:MULTISPECIES: hypothetical protein [Oscillatoriales]MBD2182427.1 hypothetical protein [Aerosakkonema funiforme FACHB-1375]
MESQAGFIFKVLIFSTALSVLIKYGGPVLNVTANQSLALTLVLLPSAIVGLLLWGRVWQQGK